MSVNSTVLKSVVWGCFLLFTTNGYAEDKAVQKSIAKSQNSGISASQDAKVSMPRGYSIPIIDMAHEKHRQVIVDKEPGQYLGHPTTVLLEDNKTMICVYPKGHGRGAIVMKRSSDAGLTWSERLPVPENWATSKEVPTIHRVIDAQGKKRLIMFSGLYPIRMAVSEDDGINWTPLKPIGDFGGIVTMGCVTDLKTGKGHYLAMFHDDGRFFIKDGKRTNTMTVYKTFSADGGLTWSFPEVVWKGSEIHLCEPGIIRSPDGKQLAVLLRENARRQNSHVIFSNDEGKTWTKPRELPGALTGDRHTGKYAPDGRLFISFRDTTLESPTKGDWVGWVGTYDDIVLGREGQYRVRLMDNQHRWDCAYPGVEILPDGTFITTTYGHWIKDESPFVVSVRFTLDELDAKAAEMEKSNSEKKAISEPELTDVFLSGNGYHTYRIPAAIVTQKGTVLAFCEGRNHRGDHAKNDIVLKRSTDGGKTWGPMQIIAEDGEHCLNNPQAVVVGESGRIIFMYVRFPQGIHTNKVVPGYDPDTTCRVFQMHSDDDGITWSSPREISKMVKRPTQVTTAAPGIGVGFELRRGTNKGRLIMPFLNQRRDMGRNACAVYSDDQGETWKYGEYPELTGPSRPGEVQMVELIDGSILLNARSTKIKQRNIAISKDGGQTFSPLADDQALIEPPCQATILRYTDPIDGYKSRVIFANPASSKGRINGMVRLSYDEGKTWPVAKTIYPDSYAYSSLTVLPDNTIGCLFECDGYKKITLARFTLAWLTDGKDSLASLEKENK